MEDIKDKLNRVAALVGGTDALERDLALSLLREVYSAIKFGGSAAATSAEEKVAVAETPTQAPEAVDAATLEGEDCQWAEDPAARETAAVEPEDRKPESAAAPEQEREIATSAPEPNSEPIIRRMVDPKVIRSLYGTGADDAVPTHETQSEPRHPRAEFKSTPTLGDSMAAGHRALGETLHGTGRNGAPPIAAAGPALSRGLRGSIGLNDRFLMIRDMFDGDAVAFDRAITRLDGFTDLDDAVIWIRENFDWSAESRGAALLIGLLERKLGR
jgi:hypothetical protein